VLGRLITVARGEHFQISHDVHAFLLFVFFVRPLDQRAAQFSLFGADLGQLFWELSRHLFDFSQLNYMTSSGTFLRRNFNDLKIVRF